MLKSLRKSVQLSGNNIIGAKVCHRQTDRQIFWPHIQGYADFFFQLNFLPPYSLHSQGDNMYTCSLYNRVQIIGKRPIITISFFHWALVFPEPWLRTTGLNASYINDVFLEANYVPRVVQLMTIFSVISLKAMNALFPRNKNAKLIFSFENFWHRKSLVITNGFKQHDCSP